MDDNLEIVKGEFLFSFDKEKIYNFFRDYPHNMTISEVITFDNENPEWAEFLRIVSNESRATGVKKAGSSIFYLQRKKER